MRTRQLAIVATCALLSGMFHDALAYESQIEPTRYLQANCSGTNFNLHWGHVAIPVYVSTDSTYGVQLIRNTPSTFWTSAAFVEQVKIALDEFNISNGALIRLYYAGITSASTTTSGIIIKSDPTPASAVGHAVASAWSCLAPNRGQISAAEVFAHRVASSGGDRVFTGWDGNVGLGTDIFAILTHEIGHAVGLGHSNQATLLDSAGHSYEIDNNTVMNTSFQLSTRHWTKYEKDTLRYLYSPNSGDVTFYQSGPSRGYGTSWTSNNPAPAPVANVGGIGKLTETAERVLYGWSDPYDPRIKGRTRSNFGGYSSFFGPTSPAVGAPPAMTASVPVNVSGGKPVTVSSVQTCGGCQFGGSNAVDGNASTRWSSEPSNPQWITIDLLSVVTISRIRISWTTSYAVAYKIQTSADNASWTDVYTVTSGNGGIDAWSGVATARYVRIYCTQSATIYGYSLWDIDVLSAPEYRLYWLEAGPDIPVAFPAPPGTVAPYGLGFVRRKIYWAKSVDSVNWTSMGFLVNPSNSQAITTWTDSVSASYDPYRRVFAALWIDDQYNGRMMTMPGPFSAQSSNVYSALNTSFWEVPSLACRNTEIGFQPGCMIVGMQHAISAPLYVLIGEITGSGTYATSQAQQYLDMPQTQTPSVWSSWSGLFLLGVLERGGNAITVYRRALTDTTWTAVLNINRSLEYLSPPVLGGSFSMEINTGGFRDDGWKHAVVGFVAYGP